VVKGKNEYAYQRNRMLRELRQKRGFEDPRVLAAMARVPRHLFVAKSLAAQSYGDSPLPIGGGQTISQPYVVARMTEWLEVASHHAVLEIGTGSGYQTAVLACLARCVYSIERFGELARGAIARMRELELDNVKIYTADGTIGRSDLAPFDRILVTAGAERVPGPLLAQLAAGGRLIIPEGDRKGQRLVLYEKAGERIERREGEAVSFVPLVGRHGWQAGD
jgi:protein-L-isoaspartate(D-aspartate) O-methyltransferase